MINKLLVWLFGRTWSEHFTGLLPDNRTEEERQKDYSHDERVFPAAADPFGFQRITVSPYPYQNQYSTSSCVPHAIGLALAIERKNDTGTFTSLAPMFPYRLRQNYPGEGAVPSNIFNIDAKRGAPLLSTLPTPITEQGANNIALTSQMYTEAEIFKGKEFYIVKNSINDIYTLANIAAQGHGVAITLFATYEEYAQSTPQIYNPKLTIGQAEVAHEVCILPNSGFTVNGLRYVTIQDSAWFGGYRLRYLSEAFIKVRVTSAGYWDTVSIISTGVRPVHVFTMTLKYGATGDEVKAMQQLLIAEGCLPADCATGLFAGRTLAGLHAFQNKYAADILTPLGLDTPTDVWGKACIAQANRLCV